MPTRSTSYLLAPRLASGLAWVLACCCIPCFIAPFEAAARDGVLEEDLAQIRKYSAVLQTPLRPSERHLWRKYISHLTGEVGEPHLTAIQGLLSLQLPAASFPLIDVLEDPEFPYRVEAAEALVKNPHPAALQALIGVLNDSDPKLRRYAARALGMVAALTVERDVDVGAATNKLMEVLVLDSDPMVRVSAFQGLAKYGSLEVLDKAFDVAVQDSHRLVQCGLLVVAARLALDGRPNKRREYSRAAVGDLLDATTTPEALGVMTRARFREAHHSPIDSYNDCIDTTEESLSVMAMMKYPRVLPVLLRLTDTADAGLRATVIRGLAEFKSPAAFDVVITALDDPISGVRKAAIEGLGASADPKAGANLSDVLINGSLYEQLAAAVALQDPVEDDGPLVPLIPTFGAARNRDPAESRWGRAESDALIQAFADRDARVRQAAEKALRTKPSNAERSLVAAFSAEQAHVRIRAARLLSEYDSVASLELLIQTLDAGKAPESEASALALGLRGDEAAREALERATTSTRSDLATAATDALSDLDRRRSRPRSVP